MFVCHAIKMYKLDKYIYELGCKEPKAAIFFFIALNVYLTSVTLIPQPQPLPALLLNISINLEIKKKFKFKYTFIKSLIFINFNQKKMRTNHLISLNSILFLNEAIFETNYFEYQKQERSKTIFYFCILFARICLYSV